MRHDIKRILYATDLSPNATYALDHAILMAEKYDATITVLHVIDKTMDNSHMVLFGYVSQMQTEENSKQQIDQITHEINRRLNRAAERQSPEKGSAAEVIASVEVHHGYPADEILKQADALQCDAIVMGTHGKGLVSQAFFGSVAKQVLRRVRKPVFIIPLPEDVPGIGLQHG
jgi:nucleotide-binding universal stress UspA family protein